jgi:hypothetical protein
VVVGVGVVPVPATTGGAECEDSADSLIGPAPMLKPATTDIAAAATAPDAMRRLRTKYSRGPATAGGTTAGSGTSGRGCPKVCDVKTSSKVA